MLRTTAAAACLSAAFLLAGAAGAQSFVYPQKGQSPEQQATDEGECHVWAINQSGFDPTAVSASPPPSQEASKGGTLRGGARGAAAGAAVGAIAGDAGKGAKIGAVGGAAGGTMRRRDQQRQQDAQKQNWQAEQEAGRQSYHRARAACLEGRGYSVK
jgi:hypothetical protein